MDKLFLLDAYALIYRAYYAFIKNPRINSKGENTSAILGFVNTLEEVLQKEHPTHIGVAFDPHGGTFRHEKYPAYKAQREETPEAIRFAVPKIKELLTAYRIPVLEVQGFEADDVIGALAHQADLKGIETYMMTPDKDYGQLVTENVKMYKPAHGSGDAEIWGTNEVCEKWDIDNPIQVIDLLGLMGDSSDNFPGCPGVGGKTASKLIRQFGSIESLLERTSELKGAMKTKVEEHIEDIKISKWLATIRLDVPITLDMEDLKAEEPDMDNLIKLFQELEFNHLLKKKNPAFASAQGNESQTANASKRKTKKDKVPEGQMDMFSMFDAVDNNSTPSSNGTASQTSAVSDTSTSTLTVTLTPEAMSEGSALVYKTYKDCNVDYQLVDTTEKRQALIALLKDAKEICLDTETTNINPLKAKLVGISFAIKTQQAFYVPITQDSIIEEFRSIYENEETLKIGQNLKYDLTVLANYGIHLSGRMFDTMIAHYLLHPEMKHGMDYLAAAYLGYQTIHIDELIGKKEKGKKQKTMDELTPEEVYVYASEDADITLQLKQLFEPQLEEGGVERLFWDIEMPLMPVLAMMEREGVKLDTESLKETSVLFTEKMNELETEIQQLAGMEFNVASPKQVGEVLFEHLKLNSKAKKTKTGQYATSEEVLEAIRGKHPIVEKILEHRGLKKLLGTYIDALPLLISEQSGHIHTSFNQAVTTTGRLSSSDPNLQNIPVRDAAGKEVRKAFIADEGEEFFSADYSQIELRLMAHLSGDENLIEAFREGHDIHAATAAKIYKKTIEEVTREERSRAKTANFGIIYGISAFGLAERMGVSRTEAKQLIDEYFNTYPGVKQYMDESIEKARQKGYTETLFGRRCYLPDINSNNSIVRGYAERNAINAPIQGTAADIIKIAMVRVARRMKAEGLKSKMILQVHDELNFSVLPSEKEQLQRLVVEEMEAAAQLSVPLRADCGWGKNWLEAH
ncbi:MAG: DNA polymerase I [Bacteroidales bacterium]|nr:DNA polymerase I [Bacteroidales bacterium]